MSYNNCGDERQSYNRPSGAPPHGGGHPGGFQGQLPSGFQGQLPSGGGFQGGGGHCVDPSRFEQQHQQQQGDDFNAYGRPDQGTFGGHQQQRPQDQQGRYEQEGRYEQQGRPQQHQQYQQQGGRYEQEGRPQEHQSQSRYEQEQQRPQQHQQESRYEQHSRPQHQQQGYGGQQHQQANYGQQRPHDANAPRPAGNDAGDDFSSYANYKPQNTGVDMSALGDKRQYQQNFGGGNEPGRIGSANWRPPTNTPAMQKQHFTYSACTGRRRALLVGINYKGQDGELRGCINDVKNLQQFLQTHGYRDEVTVLTEETNDPQKTPTKANIQRWMNWLVEGAKKDDALFFHYSGHGVQVKVDNAAEADGLGEAICPLDYKQAGMILDMEIYNCMVKQLPAGCRLTAIFDACHSGSAMNLPYMYSTKGTVKEPNFAAGAGKALLTAGMGYAKDGNTGGALSSLFGAAKTMFNEKQAGDLLRQQNTSEADVISWSGCKDDQTSADTTEEGQATGAMSYAFVKALTAKPNQSYVELLKSVRQAMTEGGYTQKPQLSACHPIDTELDFVA